MGRNRPAEQPAVQQRGSAAPRVRKDARRTPSRRQDRLAGTDEDIGEVTELEHPTLRRRLEAERLAQTASPTLAIGDDERFTTAGHDTDRSLPEESRDCPKGW